MDTSEWMGLGILSKELIDLNLFVTFRKESTMSVRKESVINSSSSKTVQVNIDRWI